MSPCTGCPGVREDVDTLRTEDVEPSWNVARRSKRSRSRTWALYRVRVRSGRGKGVISWRVFDRGSVLGCLHQCQGKHGFPALRMGGGEKAIAAAGGGAKRSGGRARYERCCARQEADDCQSGVKVSITTRRRGESKHVLGSQVLCGDDEDEPAKPRDGNGGTGWWFRPRHRAPAMCRELVS